MSCNWVTVVRKWLVTGQFCRLYFYSNRFSKFQILFLSFDFNDLETDV